MNAKDYFYKCAQWNNDIINQVEPSDYTNLTPASEWDVQALLAHIASELAWVEPLVLGKTIEQVGDSLNGDLLGKNPVNSINELCKQACEAVEKNHDLKSPVHLSYGDFDVEYYISEMACDLLIHGWDVASSINVDRNMPDELAQHCYELVLPRAAEFATSGLFGKKLAVPDNAKLQIKLLAFYGRKADWQAN